MGFIMDRAKRNWQARCIYERIIDRASDIEYCFRNIPGFYFEISNFENGRERGYTIKVQRREISWAEARSSDDIVVYPFKWDNPDQEQLDNDYQTKTKRFKYQQFQQVFNYILEYLGISMTSGTINMDLYSEAS